MTLQRFYWGKPSTMKSLQNNNAKIGSQKKSKEKEAPNQEEETTNEEETGSFTDDVSKKIKEKVEKEEQEWQGRSGKNVIRSVNVRVGQNFFRNIVLNNFDSKCAISGINIPQMLRASHIIPWAKDEQHRVNPENGLCLSALYDLAYDQGFIGVATNHKVILADKLKKQRKEPYFQEHFGKLEGVEIRSPSKFFPRKEFL
eukprot:gene5140-6414_t